MTSTAAASITVILPTRNEAANIAEVLSRIDHVGICSQIVVVDDSDDETARLARQTDLVGATVVVHHREGDERDGGLGTAIVAGLERSDGEIVVVMDADLQHPPELLPTLVEPLSRVELCIASRFNWDNVIAGLSPLRRIGSRAAGKLAFVLFPSALRHVSDPMSGYFAVRRSALDSSRLDPLGYKILLEILGTHRHLRVEEVPFSFGRRLEGESKAGLKEGLRFLRHLIELRKRTKSQELKRTESEGASVSDSAIMRSGVGYVSERDAANTDSANTDSVSFDSAGFDSTSFDSTSFDSTVVDEERTAS